MNIVNRMDYITNHNEYSNKKKRHKYKDKQIFQENQKSEERKFSEKNADIKDIYHVLNAQALKSKKIRTSDERSESKTDTEIVVKPDGSRVLVITMGIGEMETTMSLEISKPTDMQNDNSKQVQTESDNGTVSQESMEEKDITASIDDV